MIKLVHEEVRKALPGRRLAFNHYYNLEELPADLSVLPGERVLSAVDAYRRAAESWPRRRRREARVSRTAFVADLGLDKVFIYRFDVDKGTLTANDPAFVAMAPGAGPRHFAFHPSGKFAYVINELNSTVTAMSYDAERGALTKIESVSTLPAGYKGNTTTAEVVVHPSGKFLYGSNRGHDSIAVFAIDPKTGGLTLVGHQGKGIKEPRGFGIDPTGAYLIVGNQNGKSIVVFKIDAATGELKETGTVAEVGAPVCVKMIPLPG